MRKLILLFLGCYFLFFSSAFAQMKNITNLARSSEEISITGYMNYPPFGYFEEKTISAKAKPQLVYHSIFEDVFEDFKQKSNVKIKYIYDINSNFENYISQINAGNIDIFLGAYFDTKTFQRLELVYPALLNNPVILITRPETSTKIQKISQLKKMKGAICSQDHFSDFVQKQLKDYSLVSTSSSFELFEKLYTGEVDFVLATQYYAIIEATKLGIRNYLSFSKQVIWNMPIFIGVSQLSPNRKFLTQKLASYSENPEYQKKFEKKLRETIKNIELKYRGVVPPPFIKEEN